MEPFNTQIMKLKTPDIPETKVSMRTHEKTHSANTQRWANMVSIIHIGPICDTCPDSTQFLPHQCSLPMEACAASYGVEAIGEVPSFMHFP